MDAKALLRRYLEQRRELGERELQLDDLSVEEVLGIIAVSPSGGAGERRRRSAVEEDVSADQAPRPGSIRERASEMPDDWRAALRAAGASPDKVSSNEVPNESAPTQPANSTQSARKLDLSEFGPAGIDASPAEVPLGHAASFNTLDEIAASIASCQRCSLFSTAKNPVPGSGNPNADFMCVGEAPGQNEDEQGLPFVGAAGQLLTKILEAIDLRRDDVFIANVLKHRPPGNRNPLPEEVVACSPYLVRQIQLVKPKVLLALGTFAAQTLLETKTPIGKLRGQIHHYHGVPLIVTYHPAALLRNPAWKRPTWEDVQLARRILDRARTES